MKADLRTVNRLSRKRPCDKCGARVGEACKTAEGNPAPKPHLYRLRYAMARLARRANNERR